MLSVQHVRLYAYMMYSTCIHAIRNLYSASEAKLYVIQAMGHGSGI